MQVHLDIEKETPHAEKLIECGLKWCDKDQRWEGPVVRQLIGTDLSEYCLDNDLDLKRNNGDTVPIFKQESLLNLL